MNDVFATGTTVTLHCASKWVIF